jgi:hypothetical protein
MARFSAVAFVVGGVALAATPALAQVPTPTNNELQQLFDSLGEPIDAFSDGNIEPTTFTPDCVIQFEFIGKVFSIYNNQFGWYNVQGRRPTVGELYPIFNSNDEPGATASLDIREDARYAGGDIGFWLKTAEGCGFLDWDADITRDCGYLYFSEPEWSDDGGEVVHLLIFDSPTRRGFYFAWEDLFEGGDNDFSDHVTFVSNIVCTGAGEVCDTGLEGVCAAGTLQCRSGDLTCMPAQQSRQEQCNGLDDDCDGVVDNGDDLCAPTEICRFGECIRRCTGGEITCPLERTCVEGVCVEHACAGVSCPGGSVCRGGECVAPCDGVVCPGNLQCVEGACVDRCAGLTCPEGLVCEDGVCVTACDCAPGRCAEQDLMCGGSGACLEPGCEGVACAAGEVCRSGACVAACAGAVCPGGFMCDVGQCVADPASEDDDEGDPVTPSPQDAGSGGHSGSGDDAGTGHNGGDAGPQDATGGFQVPDDHTCGCRTVGARTPPSPLALLVLGVAAVAIRRLRRRGRPA